MVLEIQCEGEEAHRFIEVLLETMTVVGIMIAALLLEILSDLDPTITKEDGQVSLRVVMTIEDERFSLLFERDAGKESGKAIDVMLVDDAEVSRMQ